MSGKDYRTTIENLIENSKKKLTLKEIVEKTSIPKTTVYRIVKQIGYEYDNTKSAWNKGLTKDNNKSIMEMSKKKQQCVGWNHDDSTKKKISSSMKGKGGVREAGGRGNAYNYGDDVVNSDYELKIAELLDSEEIFWNNKDNIKYYSDNGVTRMISLGFYLPKYDIYMVVKYHINNDNRRRIRLAEEQLNIKVLIVDEMMFRRIVYTSIKNVLKNSLQNK